MGWSCGAGASDLLFDVWSKDCYTQSGLSNGYTGKDGRRYFYETSRREHNDGAVTGTTYRYVNETQVRACGSFRIEGHGDVTRYPTSWPFAKPAPFVVPTFSASWDTLDAASLPPISGGAHDDDAIVLYTVMVCHADGTTEQIGEPRAYVNAVCGFDYAKRAYPDADVALFDADGEIAHRRPGVNAYPPVSGADHPAPLPAVAPVVAPDASYTVCEMCGAIGSVTPCDMRPDAGILSACDLCRAVYGHSDLDLLSRPESLPAKPFGVCPSCNYSAAASWTVDHCPSCGYEPAVPTGAEQDAAFNRMRALRRHPDRGAYLNAIKDFGRICRERCDAVLARSAGQTLAAVALTNVAAFLLVLAVLALVIRANLPDGVLSLV